ncbi:glycosyltransferase family 39 protein [Halobacteriovorax sp. HLS]|uniref:ArnT family glycosyltransferase n=1 Tax=Halobacteriovorax sp. HLS TaxID=2234000 RepID=UPI000FD9CD16|nr:glycosyltransferase family 39 protein [Halobacteriovorax sp. HLS]
MKIKHEDLFKYIILFIVFMLYSWGIGNLDAIRQGTEGFYLQIAKEMYEMKSFLVPQYNEMDHWSKPPLQFWMAHIGYLFAGGPGIFTSRLIIVLFSISTIFLISKKVSSLIRTPFLNIFIFILATVGMFKYSRIFMMEMPLTTLTTLASLYFYLYLKDEKYSLWIGSIFLALSILVKGPVSLVMATGGCGLFLIVDSYLNGINFIKFKKVFNWSFVGLLLGSVWFFICYLQYGNAFFDYFFLRENMGKFQARPYPMRHVFQGLLIFSLPWSLYLPTTISQFKDHFQEIKKDSFLLFSICNFLVFFLLWLVPSQRSHHYAMPSLIFFLIINYILLTSYALNSKRKSMIRLANITLSTLMVITSVAFACLLIFKEVNSSISLTIKVITTCVLLLIGSYYFLRSKKLLNKYLISFFIIGNVWNIFIPSFILPYVPEAVIKTIGNKQVGALVRKPYFIEEALERKVDWLNDQTIRQYIIENNHFYIVHRNTYEQLNLKKLTDVVTTWKVWKRGSKAKDISKALKNNDIAILKDTVYLLKNKPLK